MPDTLTIGDTVRLTGTWTNAENSAPLDPVTVTCTVTAPDDTVTAYEYGDAAELIRASMGIYYLDLLLNQAGTWYYRFTSAGGGLDSDEATSLLVNDNTPARGCISPEDSLHDGCPVLGKTRTLIVSKGENACVEWVVRNRNGNPVDLSVADNIVVRFQDAMGVDPGLYELDATPLDGANGLITFQLTPDLVDEACVWQLQIGWRDEDDNVLGTEIGYLSVERGLFGDVMSVDGPLTINEVRMQLRDTMIENDLLDDVEFDDVEIIHSMIQPVREWNEKPPPVAYFNPGSFPYHYHWLQAVVANLLLTAAHWYERNNLQASHGGITVADRAKANPYLMVAKGLRQEWLEFVLSKKVSINASLAYGMVTSPY